MGLTHGLHLDFPIQHVSGAGARLAFSRVDGPRKHPIALGSRHHTTHHSWQQRLYDMSSLLDAVLHSDAAPTPSSDAGYAGLTPRMRSSSARPRGPPSESAGGHSDHEGFADDEVVGARVPGRRPNAVRADVPKQADKVGETVAAQFQSFLEE